MCDFFLNTTVTFKAQTEPLFNTEENATHSNRSH